jgi:tRNA nucleotidyltransferase (CCA-adding enzyme)
MALSLPVFEDETLMTVPGWEHFPHGADIGIRGFGRSKAEAFEQAAVALTAVISEPDCVSGRTAVSIGCTAPDDELLLVEWLNALVYEIAISHMLFSRFSVQIENGNLSATAWGEAIDIEKHQPAVEVKGATCTALSVGHDAAGKWVAQCVVDV